MSDPGTPPPPMPPQGGYPPPPPSKKNGGFPVKGCLIAAGIGVIVFLIALGGCVIVGVKIFNAVKGPVDSTNIYLKAVKTKDLSKQTEYTCPGSDPKSTLTKFQVDPNAIDSYRISFSSFNNGEGFAAGTITSNGASHNVGIHLKKTDGKWQVCEFIAQPEIPDFSTSTTY